MSNRKLLISFLSLLALAIATPIATAYAQNYGTCLTRHDGQQICVGNLVLDSSNNAGQVLQLFTNGEAQVRYTAGYASGQVGTTSIEYLSRSIGCWYNVCEHNRVVDGSGNVGTVEAVFQNGMTLLCYESGYYAGTKQIVSANTLSPAMGPQPQPYPQPQPVPPGYNVPHACYGSCQIGAMCTDACPYGASCNYVYGARPPFWRVLSCPR